MCTKDKQVIDKISLLPIETLASSYKFRIRKRGKFSAVDFVRGFFDFFLSGGTSLRAWAERISMHSGEKLSKQGLVHRLNPQVQAFCKALFRAALRQEVEGAYRVHNPDLFTSFSSVYVEDSSCFSMPDNLASTFHGPHSKRTGSASATMRIQLRLDLLSEQYTNVEVQRFRDNDQKHAPAIVADISAGELIIRDLGYWNLKVMRQIGEKGGFFLSRYMFGIKLYDTQTGELLELEKHLKRAKRKGIDVLDLSLDAGKTERLPLRCVLLRIPEKIAAQRRRKVRNDPDQRKKRSQAYFELLDWMILVTNVSKSEWSATDVFKAYGFRWRIEMVFKCWKSQLKLHKLFDGKSSLTPQRAYISIYLALCWLLVFFTSWLAYFSKLVWKKKQVLISIAAFANFVKQNFDKILHAKELHQFAEHISYYCALEKRKKRPSQLHALYEIKT